MKLSEFSLFSELDSGQCEELESLAVGKAYRRNTVILSEGDAANRMYLVLEGRVKVFRNDVDDGRQIVLNEFGPGEYFGELALITGQPRTASALTQTDCTLLTLTRPSFMTILERHPQVAMQLMCDMATRIGRVTDDLHSLAFMDVYGRIAKLINENAAERDGRLITPPFTHQDIASRVGSSREMVSKILRDLRQGGYLSVDGKCLVVEKQLPPRW